MKEKTNKNVDLKLLIAPAIIAIALVSAVYYVSHREITDPSVLIAKTIDASEDVNSYRFNISTELSTPIREENVEMLIGEGGVDYQNKKLRTAMTAMNRSIVTMRKKENGWILTVIPDREEVIEQMKKTGRGLETIKEDELRNFPITYGIEKGSYHITKVESEVELEMNIKGLVTPMELNNSVRLYDYNKELEIEAPI